MGDVRPKPWEEFPEIWSTQGAFLTYLRGGVRRGLWNESPIKLQFANSARRRIVNTNPRSKKAHPMIWGGTCYSCGKDFPMKELEVDHLDGHHSLRSMDDLHNFIEAIVFVSKDGLGLICKPCHKIKSYSDMTGMNFEDAAIEKQAITICKAKADKVKAWLEDRGVVPAKTAKLRRIQVVQLLKENA